MVKTKIMQRKTTAIKPNGNTYCKAFRRARQHNYPAATTSLRSVAEPVRYVAENEMMNK